MYGGEAWILKVNKINIGKSRNEISVTCTWFSKTTHKLERYNPTDLREKLGVLNTISKDEDQQTNCLQCVH
jgi:hypothetical protein